jgi:hypothetical protein
VESIITWTFGNISNKAKVIAPSWEREIDSRLSLPALMTGSSLEGH